MLGAAERGLVARSALANALRAAGSAERSLLNAGRP
jgi:hypothetical protein